VKEILGLPPVKKTLQKSASFLEYIALLAVVLVIWALVSASGKVSPVVMPPPKTILDTFVSLLRDGTLLKHVGISIARVLHGYCLAAASGLVLGTALGLSPRLNRMTDLIIQVVKPIPPIAWIPLAIVWFGIGEESKTFLIFLGGFFNILINVIDGIRQTDEKLVEVSRSFETPQWKFVSQLIIPSALPGIFTGLRTGLSTCWMCVIAAELVASNTGVGFMIDNARQFGQANKVIVGMIAIGITGKVMDVMIRAAEKRVMRWR
jgi:sulfonate transport system permease protein